jgi:hypothetical protein
MTRMERPAGSFSVEPHPAEIQSYNDFAHPDVVQASDFSGARVADGQLSLTCRRTLW